MRAAIDNFIDNSPEIFKYLICECHHKDNGKSVYLQKKNEIAFFFLIDNHYIKNGGKKADILVYYYNYEPETITEKDGRLIMIELKGGNIKKAIKQIDATIKNSSISKFWNRFTGIKIAGIVSSGGSPSQCRSEIEQFKKSHNTVNLKIIRKQDVCLREFF